MKKIIFVLVLQVSPIIFFSQENDKLIQQQTGETIYTSTKDGIKKDTSSDDVNVRKALSKIKEENRNVPLLKLICSPEKYNGETIQVIGYLRVDFEDHALYLHEEDYRHGMTKNAFWIEFSDKLSKLKDIREYNGKYVIIIGTFDLKDTGHMGLFSGCLKNCVRLDKWR